VLFPWHTTQAASLWQKRGKGLNACVALLSQLRAYNAAAPPFNVPAPSSSDRLEVRSWWYALLQNERASEVAALAILLLDVKPHSAEPERAFSIAANLKTKARNRLSAAKTGMCTAIKMYYAYHEPTTRASNAARRAAERQADAAANMEYGSKAELEWEAPGVSEEAVQEALQALQEAEAAEHAEYVQMRLAAIPAELAKARETVDQAVRSTGPSSTLPLGALAAQIQITRLKSEQDGLLNLMSPMSLLMGTWDGLDLRSSLFAGGSAGSSGAVGAPEDALGLGNCTEEFNVLDLL